MLLGENGRCHDPETWQFMPGLGATTRRQPRSAWAACGRWADFYTHGPDSRRRRPNPAAPRASPPQGWRNPRLDGNRGRGSIRRVPVPGELESGTRRRIPDGNRGWGGDDPPDSGKSGTGMPVGMIPRRIAAAAPGLGSRETPPFFPSGRKRGNREAVSGNSTGVCRYPE